MKLKFIVILLAVAFCVSCSQLSGPSDTDIKHCVKSQLEQAGLLGTRFELTSPVEILERGSVIKQGDQKLYPVKVRYSYTLHSPYRPSEPHASEIEVLNFVKMQDQMGRYKWAY